MIRLKLVKCSEEHFLKIKNNLEPLEREYIEFIKNSGLDKLAINSVIEFDGTDNIFYKEVGCRAKPYSNIRFTQHYMVGTHNIYVLKYTNVIKLETELNIKYIEQVASLHKGKFDLICCEDIKKSLNLEKAIRHTMDITTFLRNYANTWIVELYDSLLSCTICNFETKRVYRLIDFLETFSYIRR